MTRKTSRPPSRSGLVTAASASGREPGGTEFTKDSVAGLGLPAPAVTLAAYTALVATYRAHVLRDHRADAQRAMVRTSTRSPTRTISDMSQVLGEGIEAIHQGDPAEAPAALTALSRHAGLLNGWAQLPGQERARFLLRRVWAAATRNLCLPAVEPAAHALATQLQARAREQIDKAGGGALSAWLDRGLDPMPDADCAVTAAVILTAALRQHTDSPCWHCARPLTETWVPS